VWSRSLGVQSLYSVCLSVTNGNRFVEAVKVIRKEKADRSYHVRRYSMPVVRMRQGMFYKNPVNTAWFGFISALP